MRKTLVLALVLPMLLALCACGTERSTQQTDMSTQETETNTTQQENVQIIHNTQTVVIPKSDPGMTSQEVSENGLPENMPTPVGDENFIIEAVKTVYDVRETGNLMYMYVKVRNLTQYRPPNHYFAFLYTVIDEQGDALTKTQLLGCTDIALPEKAQWLDAYCDEEGAAGLRILGYQVYGDTDIKIYYENPPEFYSKDYRIIYE